MGTQEEKISKCKLSKIKEQTPVNETIEICTSYLKDVSKVYIKQVTGNCW
jgi:hypothetical protein